MGCSSSHYSEEELLKALYLHYKNQHNLPIIVGGNETAKGLSYVGGYSALKDYGNSVFSKTKEDLIRGLAKDVGGILGIKGAENASVENIIEKFKSVLPKPGTGKGTLKADAGKHARLCQLLAKAINNRYGIEIIDGNAEPHIICQRVAELMYSLFTGLHTEFLNVAGDVSRIIKNLEVLQGIVDSANQKILNDLSNTNDQGATTSAENSRELYKKISEEIRRQHVMLANLVNSSIGPVGSSLIGILEDNQDFTGLVEDLKKTTGTQIFGDKIALLLAGISDVSHSAHLVDKALNRIGMSVQEYANVQGLTSLRDKVYHHIASKKPSSEEMHKLLIAADILYRNDLAHDDIAEYLKKKSNKAVGGFGINDPSFADMADDATWTDVTATPFEGRPQSYRKSVGKQLREQQKYRNILFADFNQQIKVSYISIIESIGKIARKIGSEVKPTVTLEKFIRLLNGFSSTQPDKKNLHIALSGYRTDSLTNFTKFQYIDYLHAIKEECDELASENPLFKDIGNNITRLINLVDEFNTNFTKTLSEIHIEEGPRIQKVGGKKHKANGHHASANVKMDEDDMVDVEVSVDSDDEHKSEHGEHGEHKSEHGEHGEHKSEHGEHGEHKHKKKCEEDCAEEHEHFYGGSYGNSYGGQIADILGGIIAKIDGSKFRHFVSLKKAIREMDYYFRIANIKHGLKKSAVENEKNIANYENILGEEGGNLIDQIQKKYNALIASANGGSPPPTSGFADHKFTYTHGYAEAKTNALALYTLSLKDNFTAAAGEFTNDQKDPESGVLGGYKFLLEYIRSAKVEMLEAAQSLDLHLSQFTQNIENDPDTIKNFVQIIEQLEIVAKWFTDKSGDNFVGVFEAFPYQTAAGVAGLANRPLGAVVAADYSMVDPTHTDSGSVRNPLDKTWSLSANSAHYYADIAAPAGGAPPDSVGMFYKPRLMTRSQAIEFVKQIEKSIKGVRALENIIAIFTAVNTSTSGNIKTFMSTGLMFKAMMKYCVASVIGVGYKLVQRSDEAAGTIISNIPGLSQVIDFDQGADIANNGFNGFMIKAGVSLRFSNDYIRLGAGTAQDKLLKLCDPLELKDDVTYGSITDKIFEMCIKSMVSKIFVVIGSYSLFNRPPKGNSLYKSINASFATNPLRQIMGGGCGQTGGREITFDIDPDATELFMRLPLLAEWYRTVFEFNDKDNAINPLLNIADYSKQHDPIISIIPEMDNVWRDMCKVIFLDGRNIKEGGYPSELAHKLVASINNIYSHYKEKKRDITCKEILEEFVLEINRRYGFMMRSEIKMYLTAREQSYEQSSDLYDADDQVDFDLLDSENQYGKKSAPSDRFRSFNVSKTSSQKELTIFYNAVRRFRHSIEQNLVLDKLQGSSNDIDIDMSLSGDISMDEIVRITKLKMKKAKTPDERYKIVHSQLHGVDKFNNVDQNKLLLLHETVVNPLTLLYFTYLILNDYNKFMVTMNLAEYKKAIDDYITGGILNHGVMGIHTAGDATAGNSIDPIGVVITADNTPGNIHNWLAIKILEQNNNRFKSNAKSMYGFASESKYDEHNPEGLNNILGMVKYFNHGDAAAPNTLVSSNNSLILFGHDTNNYISGADINLIDVLVAARYNAGTEREEVLQRFALNRSQLMEDTLRRVMNLACELNGMVDVYYPGESKTKYISVNFDKIEEVCTGLFQQAKQSLSKLRKYLPIEMISRFEEIKTDNKTNAISLFYLQEHLFDRLFKNKFGNGLADGNDGLKNIWLELTHEHKFNWIANHHAYQFVNFTNVNGAIIANVNYRNVYGDNKITDSAAADPRAVGVVVYAPGKFPIPLPELTANQKQHEALHREYLYDSYGDVISKLLFWDNSKGENLIFEELGFRLLNETQETNQFPAHYIPIFTGGDSYANFKTKGLKDDIAQQLISSHVVDAKNDQIPYYNAINKKIATFVGRNDRGINPGVVGVNAHFSVLAGLKNIYDYNVEYSAATVLLGDADVKGFGDSLGGTDNIAPSQALRANRLVVLGDKHKFGLISKLNNIIYNFMKMFIDPSNKKIYKPLIEKFVNGYNSKDIIQANNINERPICNTTFVLKTALVNGVIADGSTYAADAATGFDVVRSAMCLLEPPEQAVLFSSLAAAIKTVMLGSADRSVGTVPLFVEENFASISEYQKELMRAYLPIFEKQLDLVAKRADFLKQIIEQTQCKVYKYSRIAYSCDPLIGPAQIPNLIFAGGAGLGPNIVQYNAESENDPTYTQPLRVPKVEMESARKTYLLGMATDIIATAKSLQNCVVGVQKELSDVPLFFETYKDSIVDYNNRNGQLPLMPLSIVSHLMNFSLHRCDKSGAPGAAVRDNEYTVADENKSKYHVNLLANDTGVGPGSTAFKFAYGMRGLLNPKQKPSADYIPGVAAIMDYEKLGAGAGKKTGGAGAQFDKVANQSLVEGSVLLSRFITDYFYHIQYLDRQAYNEVRKLMVDNQFVVAKIEGVLGLLAIAAPAIGAVKNMSCQTGKFGSTENSSVVTYWQNSQNIVMSVENDNLRQSVYRLISNMRQDGKNLLYSQNRSDLRIFNILDLNIVPINVHSMQREIPFINLMNYSHTFDQLVKETFGVEFKQKNILDIHGLPPNNDGTGGNVYNPNHMEFVYTDAEFVATNHPEDQLVRQLIYPNGFRRLREYVNHTYKIMAGDTSLSINRPKFLSDQMWNKVLLNNLYDNYYGNVKNNLNASRRIAEFEQVRNISEVDEIFNGAFNYIKNNHLLKVAGTTAILADIVAAYVELRVIAAFAAAVAAAPIKHNFLRIFARTITNNGTYPDAKIDAKLAGGALGANPEDLLGLILGGLGGAFAAFNAAAVGVGGVLLTAETHPLFIMDLLIACALNAATGVDAANPGNARRILLMGYGYDEAGITAVLNTLSQAVAANDDFAAASAILIINDIVVSIFNGHAPVADSVQAAFHINTAINIGTNGIENSFHNLVLDMDNNTVRTATMILNRLANAGAGVSALWIHDHTTVFGALVRPNLRTIEIKEFNVANLLIADNTDLFDGVVMQLKPIALIAATAVLKDAVDYRNTVTYEILKSMHNTYNVLNNSMIVIKNIATPLPGAVAVNRLDLSAATLAAIVRIANNGDHNVFGVDGRFIASLVAIPGFGAGGNGPIARTQVTVPDADVLQVATYIIANLGDLGLNNKGATFNRGNRPITINFVGGDTNIVSDAKEPLISGLLSINKIAPVDFAYPVVRNLAYMKQDGNINDVYTEANGNMDILQRLGIEGYLRYNTKYIRWTEWVVQLQRLVRILMRQQLEWVQDPVVREHDALAEGVTEYNSDNRGYSLQDFE